MSEDNKEKLPLDARLLSDAVIELNISRRSVGLYPAEHPIARTSIDRAHQHLAKLFEIRPEIMLGITEDSLVVDEFTLDRRNPVFREFAQSLHSKGIAAITFSAGVDRPELTRLHELITGQDMPVGAELAGLAEIEIRHVRLSPISFDSFCFVEGGRKGGSKGDIWEDYVYGLMEGRLGEGEDGISLLSIPPEAVADFVNASQQDEEENESYDRVISAYIKKKGEAKMSSEAFYKFFAFIDRLKPEIKRQFLSRAGARLNEDIGDVEAIISGMSAETFEKIAELFTEHASIIPATLKNLIDKISSIKKTEMAYFDFFCNDTAVLHDIELGDDVVRLFGEDNFHAYVGKEYEKELERMLEANPADKAVYSRFSRECEDEAIDKEALSIMLELLYSDFLTSNDYLTLITRLSDFMNTFVATGRFEEILDAYNTLRSHALEGRFRTEASGIVEYYFNSGEFISKLVDAFRIWGRKDRDSTVRLARALHNSIVKPLLDALESEGDASMRKFLLSVIEAIGSDVIPHAEQRLNDDRWFVTRNMICLIRDCHGTHQIEKIRRFIKHENISIRMEVLKTLLHFKTLDAIPQLRACLVSDIPDVRGAAIRLAGSYRVREAVPYLIRYLEKRDLFGTEAYYKTDIVRALGEIGDTRALEAFEKIYHAKSILYRGNLEDLKVEIFRSLCNFPPESIRKLVELGLSSHNKEIHNLSEHYLMSFHSTG